MDPLRREVMAPRPPAGLLGPLFVLGSTLALAMAMAAMAMAPHPRNHCRRARAIAPLPAQARVIIATPDAAPDPACSRPIYRARPDGMIDVSFEQCAGTRHPRTLPMTAPAERELPRVVDQLHALD